MALLKNAVARRAMANPVPIGKTGSQLSSRKPAHWKRLLSLSLGTAATLVLLAWALRDVALVSVWQALQQAHWDWLMVAWIAYLACYTMHAWRWQTLLGGRNNQGRFQTYLVAVFIGFGASCFLPGYAGEVIRAAIPARLDKVPFEAAFGGIVAERILDLGVVFLYLLLPIWAGALPNTALQQLPLEWIGGAIVTIWLLLVAAASCPNWVVQQVSRILVFVGLKRFQNRLATSLSHFLDGLVALRQPDRCGIALLQSFLMWGISAFTFWAGMMAFGMTEPGLWGALFTQSVTSLAAVLPAAPGAVGVFEAGIRFSLSLYEMPIDRIIAYAIAMRFLMYVTIPGIALLMAAQLGLSFRELIRPRRFPKS